MWYSSDGSFILGGDVSVGVVGTCLCYVYGLVDVGCSWVSVEVQVVWLGWGRKVRYGSF